MDIRKVESKDLASVIDLIHAFHDESLEEFGTVVDATFLVGVFEKLKNTSFVVEKDGIVIGLLAGSIEENMVSGAKIYAEIMWFVRKKDRGCGGFFQKWVEKWAKEQGMKQMMMVHMCSDKDNEEGFHRRLTRFYRGLGYRPMEVHFIKDL